MGNRHSGEKKISGTTPKLTPQKPSTNRSHIGQDTIDLDDLVERWSWSLWERTKTKSLSRHKREDLLIQINWKRVVITQNDVHFFDSSSQRLPKSQVLFRTSFTNQTSSEQRYQVKTDRTTRSTFSFTFTQSLSKSSESTMICRLPEEIVQLGGGIQREQTITLGQDTIKEHILHWTVNSPVEVAPWTRAHAQLVIDEQEYRSDFSIPVEFSGRVAVTFATRQSPDIPIKFLDGDIVQIVREAFDNNYPLKNVEILDGDEPRVHYTLRGHCFFRFGIAHHVLLSRETIDRFVSIPIIRTDHGSATTNTTNYRSVRTHFISPQIRQPSPIHLYIDEDECL